MSDVVTLDAEVLGRHRVAANDAYPAHTVRELAEASVAARPPIRFPPAAETDYQLHARQQARGARVTLSLLVIMLCLLVPGMVADSAVGPLAAAAIATVAQALLLPAWGLALALMLWRPRRSWGAIAVWVASLLLIGSLQWWAYRTAAAPTVLVSLVALCTVMVLGRFRGRYALGLVIAYGGMRAIGEWGGYTPHQTTSMQAVLEFLSLGVILVGGFWTDLAGRRAWAAQVVLRASAANDLLTGLLNARAFDSYYQRLAQHAQRLGQRQVIALVEIDHFRAYQTREGRLATDEAINAIGRVVRDFARRALDVAGRLDEATFVLVLQDCTAADAELRLEALRVQVESLERRHPVAPTGLMTVSIGAVELGGDVPVDDALSLADQQLRRAQRQGRNRIRLGLDLPASEPGQQGRPS